MPWLLDTNAWIHYLKNVDSPVRLHLQRHRVAEILTCGIVKAELYHGAKKYGVPARRVALVTETLAPHRSLPFDDACAMRYADLRNELERSGQMIGPYDLLIAATCLVFGQTLVTANVHEFRRVPGLRLEDWTIPLQ